MAASSFTDKTMRPTRANLEATLGNSAALLQSLEQRLRDCCGDATPTWKFYGQQAGWTVAYAHKKRRVFHLIPHEGFFTLVFTLGQRAVSACRESGLPETVLSAIDHARDYAEGRSIRIEIRTPEDVAAAGQLIAIKLAH